MNSEFSGAAVIDGIDLGVIKPRRCPKSPRQQG